MPGLGFGLVLGTRRFASIVVGDNARRVLEGLATFNATAAHEMGFVTRIAEAAQWPAVIEEADRTAALLTPDARAALYRTIRDADDDADVAALVRSAAAPGLKQRIARYLEAQRK